jgi:WASH complex subunit 7
MEETWEGVYEDDTHMKKPVDEHIQRTLTFVQEHEVILRTIEQATRNAVADAPETHYRAIRLVSEAPERVFQPELIFTNHALLRKVVSILVFLCDEANELEEIAHAKFFRPLQVFGTAVPAEGNSNKSSSALSQDEEESLKPGDREKMIGKFLPLLQDLCNYVERCYVVVTNIVQQLASLLKAKEHLYRSIFSNCHLFLCFRAIGRIFAILITLDSIIEGNDMIKESWSYYKTMIAYVRNDPNQFETDNPGLSKFERMLVHVDQTVLNGEIFKGSVEQNFEIFREDDVEVFIDVRSNELFFRELLLCIKEDVDNALKLVGTGAEMFERASIVQSMSLYILYRKLLPSNIQPDAKLHKYLWEVQKTLPVVILGDTVMWSVGEFLETYAFFEIKKPDPVNPAQHRRTYISAFDGQLSAKVSTLTSQCQAWMIIAESHIQPCLRHEANVDSTLDLRASILLKGLTLANRANTLAKQCLVMHSIMQVPLNKVLLQEISRLVELLKVVEFTVLRKNAAIGELNVHMLRVLYDAIYQTLQPLRHKLEAGKKSDISADLLASVVVLEKLMKSGDSFTASKQHASLIIAEIIGTSPLMPAKDAQRLQQFTKRLVTLSCFDKYITSLSDTAFLYYHKDILTPMVQTIYQLPTEVNRLQYIIAAFAEGIRMCAAVLFTEAGPYFVGYRAYIRDVINTVIIQPLCRDIENNLRIHISTKNLSHMATTNPKTENLSPLRPFLDMSPLRLLGLIIDIHQEVKHYLDTNFYNLTTIALHDWRTYADMRSLASEKLGLELMDNYLPMGSDDQGLDVLQIMRNIHVFVSRFTYNMNMQQFVEYRPDKSSKHLNTIRIQSIAASIRQHGLGVLNTTVNYTYQFLAQKFHIYSQFLFDDYIGAHLGKEHRWFKKHRHDAEVDNMYPYDRAMSFVKDIRKLGVNPNGKSFLDQFRILITEIGNALGYVRMVRSASMYFCSEAVQYLPEFDNVINFAMHSGKDAPPGAEAGSSADTSPIGAGLSDETVRAAKNLDSVIETLVKNFGEGSDYFKVLVNVFQQVLLTKEHEHLRNFYLIVPALCISWVEASLQAKDCMYKATRGVVREMYYTDDGFPVGVAYCLAILKQTRKFEALHWVDTIRSKYKIDAAKIAEQQKLRDIKDKEKAAKKEAAERAARSWFSRSKPVEVDEDDDYEDQEAIHTLQTSGKRLEAQRRETEQLFYCLSGAGIFFKRTDVDT